MTESKAAAALIARRWPDGPRCIHCHEPSPYQTSGRRVRFRCSSPDCRKDFTLTTGTIMHNSHLPLFQWLRVEEMMSKSSYEISNELNIPYKTAYSAKKRLQANGGKLL